MPVTRIDSLAAAHAAAGDDRLHEWVVDFLASEGSDNEPLAAELALRELWWDGPLRLPLAELVPLAGPDEDAVLVPIDEDEWEGDIADMIVALEDGWEPPPLIVSQTEGRLFLEDGNHRHETLTRAGEAEGWAVVAFLSKAARDRFRSTRTT